MNLIVILKIAAVLHLGLISAGLLMPGTVQLKQHIAALPPFINRLFWVYYAFIGLCLVSFGTLTFLYAEEIATGAPVARGLAWFLTAFWSLRLVAAAFVFDVRPYLTSTLYRIGYPLTNFVFGLLVVVYAYAAAFGGRV